MMQVDYFLLYSISYLLTMLNIVLIILCSFVSKIDFILNKQTFYF